MRSRAVVALVLSMSVVSIACGAPDGEQDASSGPTSTISMASMPPTSTSAPVTDSRPPGTERDCGPLTADDVAVAAGVAVSEVRRLTESTGDPTCSFTVGELTFTSWEGIPAVVDPSATTVPTPGIAGVDVPGGLTVDMERGGRYVGSVGLFPPGRAIEIRVQNDAAGPDTYPPEDGPAQRERTEAATLAVARQVAAGL